jgi:hypothetical protein
MNFLFLVTNFTKKIKDFPKRDIVNEKKYMILPDSVGEKLIYDLPIQADFFQTYL